MPLFKLFHRITNQNQYFRVRRAFFIIGHDMKLMQQLFINANR